MPWGVDAGWSAEKKGITGRPQRRRVVTQMALVNCPDCGNEISTEAYVCPKCGRPTGRRPKLPLKRFAILWLVLIIVFYVIWTLLSHK